MRGLWRGVAACGSLPAPRVAARDRGASRRRAALGLKAEEATRRREPRGQGIGVEARGRGDTLRASGAIAQLGERLLCKQEVTGSIPVGSIAVGSGRLFVCDHPRSCKPASCPIFRPSSWDGRRVPALRGTDRRISTPTVF